jgi:hypothetical protein
MIKSLSKKTLIKFAFLIPIILVAIISISHVVRWYSIANPISWAIYLSIAIEIAALSAISAAAVKVRGFSVWLVFIIVTLVQFIGNIFFCYSEIDITSKEFTDWAELISPIIESFGLDTENVSAQRRFLAILEGGLLPLISLTCLHFFIAYDDLQTIEKIDLPQALLIESIQDDQTPEKVEEKITSFDKNEDFEEIKEEAPLLEETKNEPLVLKEEKVEEKPTQPEVQPSKINKKVKKSPLENLSSKMKIILNR